MEETQEKKSETVSAPLDKKNSSMNIIIYVIIAAIIGGTAYFFAFSNKNNPKANPTPQTQQVNTQTTAPITPTSVMNPTSTMSAQQITVQGSEFSFSPSVISVKAGQKVQITFINNGKYPHNFTLSDLTVQTKTINPGEQDTVSFVPNKIGQYPFTCTVPGHVDKGMKGMLKVE